MVIMHKTMFPWKKDDPIGYWESYNAVIDNFEKSCNQKYPNQTVLFLDNTYQNLEKVTDIVSAHECDICLIFSLIDPPFPWRYLKEQLLIKFPNKKFLFIGCDHAPDFEINLPFLWFYQKLQRYPDNELLPTTFDYTFLSYNFKPHVHRTRLIDTMTEQNVIQFGYCSLPRAGNYSHRFSNSLGDMDLWQRHFLNIVNKVVFRAYSEPLCIGEKLFKPILGLRPWIINGSTRYYHELRTMGFDCYEDIFPVRELEIELDSVDATMAKNHHIICDVIRSLHGKNLKELYQQLLPRLLANRAHWEKLCQDLTQKFCIDLIELPD